MPKNRHSRLAFRLKYVEESIFVHELGSGTIKAEDGRLETEANRERATSAGIRANTKSVHHLITGAFCKAFDRAFDEGSLECPLNWREITRVPKGILKGALRQISGQLDTTTKPLEGREESTRRTTRRRRKKTSTEDGQPSRDTSHETLGDSTQPTASIMSTVTSTTASAAVNTSVGVSINATTTMSGLNAGGTGEAGISSALARLVSINEEIWIHIGRLAEQMGEYDRALSSYESALRQNPYSIGAMLQIASLFRANEQFGRAAEYFQSILNLDQTNGEVWSALGHCYLMMDDLQKTYAAYHQALYHLQNPKEPRLWYGIGILYDRYGSLEHAEEAFSQAIQIDPYFDKANEIYFRLGIIYRQQHKYTQSLECFQYVLQSPPKPLTETDIWFQIGHVYEQQKEYKLAKDVYEHILSENSDHAKVLQQLGWLYHQPNTSFTNQDLAIQYLTKSLELDNRDVQSWYFLGRCYMVQQKYNKAYEAYQQAVYRDGRNPIFWCSIGVLYYQINQYRDALDAYSRAIRLNPYISEVWYDLGTLYESCNNQIADALNAYQRAAELDPNNPHIKSRLQYLRSGKTSGSCHTAPFPHPQDINPSSYQNSSLSAGLSAQWSKSSHSNLLPSIINEVPGKLPILRPSRSNEADSPLPNQTPDILKKSSISIASNERYGQHTLSPTNYHHHTPSNPYDNDRSNHTNVPLHSPMYPLQSSQESRNGSHPIYHLTCSTNMNEDTLLTPIHTNTFNINHEMKHLNNTPNSHSSHVEHPKFLSKQSVESIIHYDVKESREVHKRQREWEEKKEVHEQKKINTLKFETKEISSEKIGEKKEAHNHNTFIKKTPTKESTTKESEFKELLGESDPTSSDNQKMMSLTFPSTPPIAKTDNVVSDYIESPENYKSSQPITDSVNENSKHNKLNNITEITNHTNVDMDEIKGSVLKKGLSGKEKNAQKIELTVREISINENYDNDNE
ncbi:hypothetical protein PMAC_000541 [Pneumocystis sp. 'macacae']|nr:hypothetical protein PMAC_000541 [Pneumocystis sp. 'macacae']